jgi:hypothetical protein
VSTKFNDACAEVLAQEVSVRACGLFEVETGIRIALRARAEAVGDLDPVRIAALVDLLRDPVLSRFESLDTPCEEPAGGDEKGRFRRELRLSSNTSNLFASVLEDGRVALILVAESTMSLGLAWSTIRTACARLEECGDSGAA